MKSTDIFKTFTFYYAEFNHPTLEHAIYIEQVQIEDLCGNLVPKKI